MVQTGKRSCFASFVGMCETCMRIPTSHSHSRNRSDATNGPRKRKLRQSQWDEFSTSTAKQKHCDICIEVRSGDKLYMQRTHEALY